MDETYDEIVGLDARQATLALRYLRQVRPLCTGEDKAAIEKLIEHIDFHVGVTDDIENAVDDLLGVEEDEAELQQIKDEAEGRTTFGRGGTL